MSDELPQALNRYKIIEEVGRGATASVYKAYDPQLDRFLALKVLRKELAQDKDYRDAFLKEARLAAQLTHSGIVTIYDVGLADNKPYIGMELLEGATLETVLKTQGKLNLRTLIAMSLQLSRALSYAHEHGVIHRDIKPANIMIVNDKKTVKLTDFGIAQLDENLGKVGKRNDKVLGTPEYMSPEQILGQSVDNRSDLYSFGILIYQMLMGLPPFMSDDLGKLFTQIIKKKPPAIIIDDAKIEDDLRDLIRRLLQKSPSKRYQKAVEVSTELRAIQNKFSNKKGNNKDNQYTSLSLRWATIMMSVALITMGISLAVVYFVQNKALSGITFDYGRSTTQMIAAKMAVPMTLQDAVGLNVMVDESSKNDLVKSIDVIDLNNKVLASTNKARIDQPFFPPSNRVLKQLVDQTTVYQRKLGDEEILFDIDWPIYFSDKHLGKIYISYTTNSMYAASRATLASIFSVMLVTLLIILIITLLLARKTSKDFQRVTQAMNKMAMGRMDARLVSSRKDEAGLMFQSFNRLASYLERYLNMDSGDELNKTVTQVKKTSPSHDSSLEETLELDIMYEDATASEDSSSEKDTIPKK